ncbi:hypothetical protein LQ772_08100 [Frateuria edaphi]|uniref:hypothetical protein n=1 Tax=Frateuria edaphi TaxID=2898793 RepID=UPI001E57B690|nr:hypothetical protein [Frateuria edaphi]UGB47231.1 hypothetical protein LQ772_08100 [Frateuria edaphi]
MSNQVNYTRLRAYNEIKTREGKKPGQVHGFQVCGIVKGEGRVEEFEQYFDAAKNPHFLPPGDYEVKATGMYLDRDGRLQIGREFEPVKPQTQAAKAA